MNVQLSLSASSSPSNWSESSSMGKSMKITDPSVSNKEPLSKVDLTGSVTTTAEEKLVQTIERAVKSLQGPQTVLEVSVHDKTHSIMVKVLNKETGELIREVPSEKILNLVANMMELAGIIVDERV